MSATPVLVEWSAQQKREFMRAPMLFDHRLCETDLFSERALEALLDGYPVDGIDINLYDFDQAGQVSLKTGARGGVSGAQLLDAVRSGRLWLNCRDIMKMAPAIGAQVRRALGEMSAMCADFAAVKSWGQLIISSPRAKVPFHADPSGVILFHLQGRKRIFIYPADEAHAPSLELEKIVAQQQVEDLPYQTSMDAAAKVFDLEPGQAITWPLYAPHRVENLSGLCVSLSVDFLTREQQVLNGAHFTNLALRQLGLRPTPAHQLSPPAQKAFWLASGVFKRMGVLKERLSALPRDFRPDPAAPDGAGVLGAVGRSVESA